METQCIFIAGFKNCFTLGHTCLVWGHNKENAGEYAGIKITFPGLALMNPLMILVKIIKLRWIHILSYDQMV
ncbi:hypothetical protein, partial [Klebsiella pneumoniae]|uniref:hypothetical protein n=1 Tax=Klebsiella pneumoniae TaxID=573 RepID=UPI0021626AA8